MDFYTFEGELYNTLSGEGDAEREIDIKAFFGNKGSREIFFDPRHRSVGKVIKEVKNHIEWLRVVPEGAWDNTYYDYEG